MSKKRDQIKRRRQISKIRKGQERSARTKAGKPLVPMEEERAETKDIWIAVGVVALVMCAFVALYYFAVLRPAKPAQTKAPTKEKVMSWSEPPEMSIDTSKDYEAVIVTEKGEVRMTLFDDKAPKTVNSFVFLARQGFYDGVTFHRVLPGFMAQTGDPTGTGSGGPGYRFEDEFDAMLRHDSEGIVSMANAGLNTNGSQFFIIYAPQPHLDDHHTVFAKVIQGMDVVNALTPRDPGKDPNAPPGDVIITVQIAEK